METLDLSLTYDFVNCYLFVSIVCNLIKSVLLSPHFQSVWAYNGALDMTDPVHFSPTPELKQKKDSGLKPTTDNMIRNKECRIIKTKIKSTKQKSIQTMIPRPHSMPSQPVQMDWFL